MPKKKSKSKRGPEKNPRDILRQAKRQQTPAQISAQIPDEIYAQVAQTEKETPAGQLPATVIHTPGRPAKDALVLVSLEAFQRYFDAKPTKTVSDSEGS